ncbi:MAG: hypothetical protein ACYDCC_15240 [Actinomycetota bacterium]
MFVFRRSTMLYEKRMVNTPSTIVTIVGAAGTGAFIGGIIQQLGSWRERSWNRKSTYRAERIERYEEYLQVLARFGLDTADAFRASAVWNDDTVRVALLKSLHDARSRLLICASKRVLKKAGDLEDGVKEALRRSISEGEEDVKKPRGEREGVDARRSRVFGEEVPPRILALAEAMRRDLY